MLILQATFAGNKQTSGNAGVCAKQVVNTWSAGCPKNPRTNQLGAGLSAHVQRPL